ncbi:hypothetical protein KA089_01140 [Candidatus Woesebacteria bacterium]|nr:hypothetical protein [Candidatus Woesebacteria bacterium]
MDIQLTQILFQIINFSVVLGALTFLLYKPVLKIFDERAKRIDEGQKAAEEAMNSRDELDKEKKRSESDIKKERAKVLTDAQEEAKKKAQDIISTAKKEAMLEQEKMIKNWQLEKAQLLKEAKLEMTDAVITISAKLIGKSLDAKSQEKLIDEEINSIIKNI